MVGMCIVIMYDVIEINGIEDGWSTTEMLCAQSSLRAEYAHGAAAANDRTFKLVSLLSRLA